MFLLITCVHVKSVVFVDATTTTAGTFVAAITFVGFFEIVIVFASFTIVDFDICDGFFCWFLPVVKNKFGIEFDVQFDVKFDVGFFEFFVVENLVGTFSNFVKI